MILGLTKSGEQPCAIWDELDPAHARKPHLPRCLRVTPLEAIVVAMIVGVLIALLLPGSDFDFAHRYSPPDPNAGSGFAALAAEYRLGQPRGGRGWCLSILPDGRYSIVSSCCTGVGYRESGTVKRIGEHVVLSAGGATAESRFARTLQPVKWGCRTYLIPAEKFEEFIDAIVQGDEPRSGIGKYYVLGLDQPVTGMPELPAPWAERLRERVLIGTIIEMTARGRARIDLGSADGIILGSELSVQGAERHVNGQGRVVRVDERTCEAQFFVTEYERTAKVGCKVIGARRNQPPETRRGT